MGGASLCEAGDLGCANVLTGHSLRSSSLSGHSHSHNASSFGDLASDSWKSTRGCPPFSGPALVYVGRGCMLWQHTAAKKRHRHAREASRLVPRLASGLKLTCLNAWAWLAVQLLAQCDCGSNQWYHFGVGAPPILEPILVGIG